MIFANIFKIILKVISGICICIGLLFGYIQIAAPSSAAKLLLPSFLHIFIPDKSVDVENKPFIQNTHDINLQMIENKNYMHPVTDVADNFHENRIRHGQDRLTFTDGTYIDGIFNNGKLLRGTYNGIDFIFDGTFKEDNDFDYGRLTTIYGSVFEGSFNLGYLQQGKAIIKYSDGCTYQGEINQGKRNGRGSLIFPDGNIFEGIFLEDNPVQGESICNGKKTAVKFVDGAFIEEKLVKSIQSSSSTIKYN